MCKLCSRPPVLPVKLFKDMIAKGFIVQENELLKLEVKTVRETAAGRLNRDQDLYLMSVSSHTPLAAMRRPRTRQQPAYYFEPRFDRDKFPLENIHDLSIQMLFIW